MLSACDYFYLPKQLGHLLHFLSCGFIGKFYPEIRGSNPGPGSNFSLENLTSIIFNHRDPISIVGDKLLRKKVQKNEMKNNTSLQ